MEYADLKRLTDRFAMTDAAQACGTPEGAYANCYALSIRFARWLRDIGVSCEVLYLTAGRQSLARAAGRWPLCPAATAQHWVVQVGSWTIDWTARQMNPDADLPHFTAVSDLPEHWENIRRWSCPDCCACVLDERHVELTAPGLAEMHRAVAAATQGLGPFSDPRHDTTAALREVCVHLSSDLDLTAPTQQTVRDAGDDLIAA